MTSKKIKLQFGLLGLKETKRHNVPARKNIAKSILT
jgi:hypothetical protein